MNSNHIIEAASTDEADGPKDDVLLSMRNVRKTYGGGLVAVKDFSLDLRRNEVVSLLGPSGCGKTTTLRCIAGLETPDAGQILVNGRPVFSDKPRISLPPEQRNLSMVFQQYALWPHMNVFQNVAFGLRIKKRSKDEVVEQTEAALRRVQLWDKRDRRIAELSGGQQQRVALARAIAFQPQLILFDEPLSNLDAKLREELRLELLELQRDLQFSAVYVTHDQDEAISLSSRIVVINAGECEQIGTPREIWRTPKTSFVASFIGSTNRISGVVQSDSGSGRAISVGEGLQVTSTAASELAYGTPVEVFIRMADIRIGDAADANGNVWNGRITLASFQGESTLYQITFGSLMLMVRQGGDAIFGVGEEITVSFAPETVRVYPLEGMKSGTAAQS